MNEKKNILVVEDEKALLRAISVSLENRGYTVIQASTAEKAMSILDSKEKVDALWLDHYLPGGKSGLDVVVHARTIPEYAHTPIFVVSNTAGSEKIYSYMKFSIDKYYVKSNNKLDAIIADISKVFKE